MSRFDWQRFCERYSVPFVTEGPNTSKGTHISVRCPFCGEADQSEHMHVHLGGKGWHCWRNQEHRGKSPVGLVQALLGCSYTRAADICGVVDREVPDETGLEAMLGRVEAAADQVADRPSPPRKLALAREFKPLLSRSPLARQFQQYLIDRRFRPSDVHWLAANYELYYAVSGRFRYRIVVPYHDIKGRLVTWTARTIVPEVEPRYLTLYAGGEPAPLASPKETFLGLNLFWRMRPRAIVLCEGPFDAMRLSLYGAPRGVWATCMSGLSLTEAQTELLEKLSRNVTTVSMVLDADADLRAFDLAQRLESLNCQIIRLPKNVPDPAELGASEATNLLDQALGGLNNAA